MLADGEGANLPAAAAPRVVGAKPARSGAWASVLGTRPGGVPTASAVTARALRTLIQTNRFIVGTLLAAQFAGGTSSVIVAPTAAPAVTSATVHHSRLGVPSGSAVTPTRRAGSGASGDRGGI